MRKRIERPESKKFEKNIWKIKVCEQVHFGLISIFMTIIFNCSKILFTLINGESSFEDVMGILPHPQNYGGISALAAFF